MPKTLITAADVAQVVGGRLLVPADAIITPLARDEAADRGIALVVDEGPRAQAARPTPAAGGLESQVRAIVTAMLGSGGGGLAAPTAGPRVKLARIGENPTAPFPYPGPPPGMRVGAVDVVTGDDGSPIAAGYMTLTEGSFPWTLTYDEVQIVLEGELHLGGDAGDQIGRPGDVFYVPKGSSITFGTPSWAKFVYVTFPANWEEQF